jgi:alpha-beta hydrolase superfamily lysophospholipase
MKATMIIIHGFAESSDLFLESSLHYAANGIDVHMIDLTGYGYSSGTRMAANSIQIFQEDLAFLLNLVNPSLPLFIYGHSMGGLTVASFLANNPNLKIAGAVLSAPLLNMAPEAGVNNLKRILIGAMVPHLDNLVLNPMIAVN